MKLMPWRKKRNNSTRDVAHPSLWSGLDMDRLFDRFFGEDWPIDLAEGREATWMPPVDITENEKEFIVRCEVPGVKRDDLSITVSGDILSLSGEKSEVSENRDEDYFHAERRFGSFQRNIQLPAEVNADEVKAEYEGGVLTVTLQRKEGAAAKRIPVSLK